MDAGRVLLDRYRVEDKLGAGGMGVVHRGTDLQLGRPVAIKVVSPEPSAGPHVEERFLREAQRTAQLRHPGIVEVFDIGRTAEGEAFFVMELLDGESLAARLERQGRVSQSFAVQIATQVCEALAVAHAAGIVHRDLKPANVMLLGAQGAEAPRVKVLDFGIAKRVDAATKLTETGMLVGTADYMSPESIKGLAVDARTDVYSLGVMLWRMLAGKPLFEGDNLAALVHAHLTVSPHRIREREPSADVTDEVEAVVRRCLAKDPDARFSSMIELRAALVAAHEKKIAPDSAPTRAPLPPLGSPSERQIEFDEPSQETRLELEDVERPPAPIVAPPREPPPPVAPAPQPSSMSTDREPEWMATARMIPERVGQGLAVAGVAGLVVLHTFFAGRLGSTLVLAAVALLGGAVMWAWHVHRRGR